MPVSCQVLRHPGTNTINRVLAPNGKDSILYKSILEVEPDAEKALRLWAQVYTPSFKEWFGDWEQLERVSREDSGNISLIESLQQSVSQTIDDNGEPSILYHGTHSTITEFNETRRDGLLGIYTTSLKNIAEQYASLSYETRKGQLYPLFVNIKSPKIYYEHNKYGDVAFLTELPKGHDGIIYNFGEEVVAFNPNQVKSVMNTGKFSTDKNDIYLQSNKGELVSSTASPGTISKVRTFLDRIGVTVSRFDKNPSVNGVADILNNLIQIADGKDNTTLTEEAMHFAVEIIEQTNPTLYKQLYNDIGKYRIYNELFSDDTYTKLYVNKENRPDVPRFRKEAIGKVLAEFIIKKNEGTTEKPDLIKKSMTWWESIVNWLKQVFNRAGFNPFEEVATQILEGNFEGTSEDISRDPIYKEVADRVNEAMTGQKNSIYKISFTQEYEKGNYRGAISILSQQLEDPTTYNTVIENFLGGDIELAEDILNLPSFFQITGNAVDQVYDKLFEQHKKISRATDGEDSFYMIGDKRVATRVTDLVKKFYNDTFRNQQITKTQEQEAIDDYKKDKGTDVHHDLEAIFHRYVDDYGFLREEPLEDNDISKINPTTKVFYKLLEDNLATRLKAYPQGTRFMSEVMVYDPKNGVRDEAGTIDFLAITPNKNNPNEPIVDILDWKTSDGSNKATDIPWYKKKAYIIQLQEYKRMLSKMYGVKNFGVTRAIPITMNYRKVEDASGNKTLELFGMGIGDVDTNTIKNLKQLPVATPDESTGNRKIDALLKKLSALYDALSKRPAEEGRKDVKNEQLNDLEKAIRTLQIQLKADDLIISGTNIMAQVKASISAYRDQLDRGEMTNDHRKQLIKSILQNYDVVQIFDDIDREFREVNLDETVRNKLRTVSNTAKDLSEEIGGLKEVLGNELALGFGIKNLLDPEFVVGFLKRNFRSLSQAATASTKVLAKIVQRSSAAIDIEYQKEFEKLQAHRKAVDKLAETSGTTTIKLIDKYLLAKNKEGAWNGDLIRKISGKFYTELSKAQQDGNMEFVKENVDTEEYIKWYEEKYKDTINYQRNQTYDFDDPVKNKEEQDKRIAKFRVEHDISSVSGITTANKQLSRYPKQEKWLSDEYKELEKQPALLEFYNYWQERMKEAYKNGMLQNVSYSRFVPNIKRSMLETAFMGIDKAKIKQSNKDKKDDREATLFGSIRASTENVVIDPLTNKPVDRIFINYIRQIDAQEKSFDLFRVMTMWNEEMVKYKYRTEIEDQVRLLSQIEHNKKAIVATKTGEISEISNEKNAEYFDNFMKSFVYGRQYSERGDITTTIKPNNMIDKINGFFDKVAGFKPLPRSDSDEITISGNKIIEMGNRWFQMKVLGFNVATSLSNLVGGTANAYISAGKYISKSDIFEGEILLPSTKMGTDAGKSFSALINYFVPMTESSKAGNARELSVSSTVKAFTTDHLFTLQRGSDKLVQYPILYAFAKNTMVENGELVNIREYAKAQNDYSNIYNLTPDKRAEVAKKIEADIAELQRERSLLKIVQVENDVAVIPGIDRQSNTVYDFRNRIQQFTKDVLGNMDQNDIYQYRMNIWMKSVMMFKNWIPRLVDVRYGELRENIGTDSYEWGRVNMLWSNLFSNILAGTKNLIGIASGKETLIQTAKRIYEEKSHDMGKGFMNEAEFIDMYVRGVTQEIREILILSTMASLLISARVYAPDDDDPEIKGAYRWGLRSIDKITDELLFFYSPASAIDIANGSLFPAMGTLKDLQKFAGNALKEGYFSITGDTEAADKNKVSKYLFKALPVTKEFMTYMLFFNAELAKEYGIQIPSVYRSN